jgi:hypothetical protein
MQSFTAAGRPPRHTDGLGHQHLTVALERAPYRPHDAAASGFGGGMGGPAVCARFALSAMAAAPFRWQRNPFRLEGQIIHLAEPIEFPHCPAKPLDEFVTHMV